MKKLGSALLLAGVIFLGSVPMSVSAQEPTTAEQVKAKLEADQQAVDEYMAAKQAEWLATQQQVAAEVAAKAAAKAALDQQIAAEAAAWAASH